MDGTGRGAWQPVLALLALLVAGCQGIEDVDRTADLSVERRAGVAGCWLDLELRNLSRGTIKPRIEYAVLGQSGLVLRKGTLAFGEMAKKTARSRSIEVAGADCGRLQKFFVARAVDDAVPDNRAEHTLRGIDDKSYRW